jgi:hypothetical protein
MIELDDDEAKVALLLVWLATDPELRLIDPGVLAAQLTPDAKETAARMRGRLERHLGRFTNPIAATAKP